MIAALAFSEPTLRARLALSLLAGLLLAASYALHPWWWAAWLAPVPLLLALGRGPVRLIAVVAGVVSISSVLSYYLQIPGAWVTLMILLLRIASLMFVLRIVQLAVRRLPLALAMLALPAGFAALEQLTLSVSVHGTAGSLAYSQMAVPALVQAAALGGVPAVVFVLLLPGSLLGLWLSRPWPRTQRIGAVATLGVLASALALFSAARMAPQAGMLRVTAISTDRFSTIPTDWPAVWAVYGRAIRQQAAAGELVVLPEKIALLDAPTAAIAERDIQAAARDTGATLVLGVEVRDAQHYRNRAVVASPDGQLAWYDKQRLVPGMERRDSPGSTPLVTPVRALASGAETVLGIAICKDMHIPSIGRQYAGRTGVMAVPAWDFGRDGWMGARMAALRAVENGYAIVRASRDGLLGAYDSAGRVIAEQPTDPDLAVLHATVPTAIRPTLYARFGDLFGWSCFAAVLLLRGIGLLGWIDKGDGANRQRSNSAPIF